MKKSLVYLLHGCFWFANILLFFIVMGVLCYNDQIEETEALYYFRLVAGVVVTPALFSFYSFYSFLFPNYLQKNRFGKATLLGILLAFIGTILGAFVIYLLLGYDLSCHAESDYFGLFLMTVIGLFYGMIALAIKIFVTWYADIKIKEELHEKNHRMELALVKSQLDPHFLFNTLNNIDVLILKSPEEASSYLNRLSDIMRFMLFETKIDFIPLSKEIEYISKYIELQKIRSANTNYVQFKIIGDQMDKTIAPMILIPFIENAFKHCTNKKIENAINIQIEIKEQSINLTCDNAFDENRKKAENSNGLGSELILKRLELIYPNRFELATNVKSDRYYIQLNIQL